MATLTRSQEARRQRVIRAAFELGAKGGYDAVQMRDVATTADVALGTIYRYFSSKDHLLAEAQVEWVKDLSRRVHARPPRAGSAADRVIDVLRRATKAMETEPRLAEALVTALASNDPHAARCQAEIGAAMADTLAIAFPDDFDPARRDDIIRTLGHVWFSSLVGWVNNWFGITKAADELAIAAHLLLDQYE
jgi:AcrR family transcriptional regulator